MGKVVELCFGPCPLGIACHVLQKLSFVYVGVSVYTMHKDLKCIQMLIKESGSLQAHARVACASCRSFIGFELLYFCNSSFPCALDRTHDRRMRRSGDRRVSFGGLSKLWCLTGAVSCEAGDSDAQNSELHHHPSLPQVCRQHPLWICQAHLYRSLAIKTSTCCRS